MKDIYIDRKSLKIIKSDGTFIFVLYYKPEKALTIVKTWKYTKNFLIRFTK